MKLAILSRSLYAYSTRRLKEAALARGHNVKVLDTLKFSIDLQRGVPDLYYRQKVLSHYDAVLPRIGASITYLCQVYFGPYPLPRIGAAITYFGTAVVRQFQEMDVFCANTASGIADARDKLRSLQILSCHHIGIPRTTFVRDKKDVLPAIERVAGVDMLESDTGPQVMEVNSSPGLEGIEACTELDIAGAVVDYIAAQVDFPEIDIRQRLTVSRGYGVAEIYVPEGSNYIGGTIRRSQLPDQDVNVLTLYRGNKAIANPRMDRVLEADDKLLCFGKLEAMRDLIPPRTRRRRHPKIKDLPESASDG